METMRAEAVADGQPPFPSAEVVSKVLSQNSSNNTFLKNVGISTPSLKSPSSSDEEALRWELDAEKQGSAILHEYLEEWKKKTKATEEALDRTARQYDKVNVGACQRHHWESSDDTHRRQFGVAVFHEPRINPQAHRIPL